MIFLAALSGSVHYVPLFATGLFFENGQMSVQVISSETCRSDEKIS